MTKTNYKVTELDRLLEQFKGISEWTNEKQLEWELNRKEESHKKELEKLAKEKSELYVENVLLKRQLKDYKNLQSEVHKDIERVWSIDSYNYSINPYDVKERSEIIERVFYKISNEWLDGDNLQPLSK
jgi:hypothetical protein